MTSWFLHFSLTADLPYGQRYRLTEDITNAVGDWLTRHGGDKNRADIQDVAMTPLSEWDSVVDLVLDAKNYISPGARNYHRGAAEKIVDRLDRAGLLLVKGKPSHDQ